MKPIVKYIIFILSFLGIADASFLTYEHYSNAIPPCSLSGFSDCGNVLRSDYAMVLGLPVALWGLLYYLMLTAISMGVIFDKKIAKMFLLILSTIGFLISLHLVYLQLAIIHAICLYCMFSASLSTVIFLLSQITFSSETRSFFRVLYLKNHKTVKKI